MDEKPEDLPLRKMGFAERISPPFLAIESNLTDILE
jgi:hypothetical protein